MMRRKPQQWVLLLVAAVLLAACAAAQPAGAPKRGQAIALADFPAGIGRGFAAGVVNGDLQPGPMPKQGDAAPDFTLLLEDGRYTTLADLKGKPVVINFWATWCAPCRMEMPELVKAAGEHADLVVLAVDAQEARAQVESFAQEFKMEMPIVLDSEGDVQRLYQVPGLPTTFFVDREGKIVSLVLGALTPQVLEARLAEIL